jgi:predicted RNA-binding Zn-ribbon protein involved in translation (DUF1610 family)
MWVHRLAIRLFTVALGVLFYWLLRFVVQDIQTMPGPDFASFESGHVRPELRERQQDLEKQLTELTRQIENQKETRRIVGDSSQNLQQTMAQLLELQKLGMQKSLPLSETEQANFATALNLFLENQRKYQDSSQAEADLVGRKQALVQEQQQIAQELSRQLEPARVEFNQAMAQHRLKLAFLQLAMLLPILGIAVVAIVRKRSSLYFPLFLAFGVATLVKVTLVMHEYFPTRYFKYILIVALLIAVAGLLVYFLRSIAFPKATWLAKQYREAYERFLCPVCEYPIRTGPRRFLFWTRRSITKQSVACDPTAQEEPYVCPACGSQLLAECPACHKIRHSLLPHCAHCGAS